MIYYCLKHVNNVPTKFVVLSLNKASYSYRADCKNVGIFSNMERKRTTERQQTVSRVEFSLVECAAMKKIALENKLEEIHVKTVKAFFKELGFNNKQKRYWNEEDGTICAHCHQPYKARIVIPHSMLKLCKNEPNICGLCLVAKLERVGHKSYLLEEKLQGELL